MNVLIVKLGATGDVVRTTPLLRRLTGYITWLTAAKNTELLKGLRDNLRCVSWEEREQALDTVYDLVINLEDTLDVAQFLKRSAAARFLAPASIPTTHCATRKIPGAGLILVSSVLMVGKKLTGSNFSTGIPIKS